MTDQRSILVYGAGAVGSFYGGMLARAGRDVRFVARGEQRRAMELKGVHIGSTIHGDVKIAPVQVFGRAADAGAVDLALVCVKTQQTAEVLDDLATAVRDETGVGALPNGAEGRWGLRFRVARHRVDSARAG